MSQYKYAEIADTVYFWFAANETTGTAGDGSDPLYDVRLAGAASDAAPTASGTPTLLSHANYGAGLYEIAIDTTGYSAGEYAVFCTLTISTVNPGGFVGSFKLRTAGTGALKVDTVAISGDSTAADNLEAACDGGSYNVGGGAVVAASVTGAVGSVTGAVGSVTGAVGSVTGNVGGNVAGSVASVTGAVGSVTGAVGSVIGNVGGSVASVTAGVTLADDAITAAKFDETTAFPVKSADAGATLIARVGAQMDLVNAPNATAIAAIKTAMEAAGGHLALILADTGELQTDWANGGRLDLLIDAIKAITDQINFTGTDVNANASVALTEGDISDIADGVAAAIKLTTGWTAGGTLTYAEVVKIIAAAVAGKVIDKAGVAGTVQHLDVEDGVTAIIENVPSNTTSPYRDITVL